MKDLEFKNEINKESNSDLYNEFIKSKIKFKNKRDLLKFQENNSISEEKLEDFYKLARKTATMYLYFFIVLFLLIIYSLYLYFGEGKKMLPFTTAMLSLAILCLFQNNKYITNLFEIKKSSKNSN